MGSLVDPYGTLTRGLWRAVALAIAFWLVLTVGMELWLFAAGTYRPVAVSLLGWLTANLVLSIIGERTVARIAVEEIPHTRGRKLVHSRPLWVTGLIAAVLFLLQCLSWSEITGLRAIAVFATTTCIPFVVIIRSQLWSTQLAARVMRERVKNMEFMR